MFRRIVFALIGTTAIMVVVVAGKTAYMILHWP
ncbi:MAG: hypothetical protein OJF58_000251 [Enhydrobacter sp.]|jgi:hypothetical protein|nr:MAG: hypothetical protein OJF58_000251 [Enhydrobacter sp.]